MYIPSIATSQLGQIAQQRMIEVENSLFKAITPTVALGEVIQLTVRQNGQSGQGLVGFRGQAIKATLPPNLQPGDQILAKVSQGQDQIILKILDLQRAQSPAAAPGTSALTRQIADQLLELIDRPEGFLNFKSTAGESGQKTAVLLTQSKELAQTLKTVSSTVDLKNPQTALTQLISASTGQVADSLREAAAAIRSLIEQHTPPAGQNFIATLKDELSSLLQSLRNGTALKDSDGNSLRLGTLLRAVREELHGNSSLSQQSRAVLEKAEKALLDKPQGRQTIEAKLEETVKSLEHQLSSSGPARMRPREVEANPAELNRLAQRLDQLASSQETLQQLNPLMQALGEPALILLPFLSQGLLNHSEVTIDPNARRRGGREGSKDGESSEEESGDTTPYQRIQVSVPLPNLGPIDVDIAHRKEELLVRITVPDAQSENFINDQLPLLYTALRLMGFDKTELVSAVGQPAEKLPVWCEGLTTRTSIIA